MISSFLAPGFDPSENDNCQTFLVSQGGEGDAEINTTITWGLVKQDKSFPRKMRTPELSMVCASSAHRSSKSGPTRQVTI